MISKYSKVIHFGEPLVADIIKGNVIIEEKIDGSQFRIFCDRLERQFGSKSVNYTEIREPDKMFRLAVDNATRLLEGIDFKEPTTIFCEFMQRPKHNSLAYDRVPINNLMVFDVKVNGKYLNYYDKMSFGEYYGFDYARLLWSGDGKEINLELIKKLLEQTSFLGGQKIEGMVFKNYTQFHIVDYLLGHPLIAKYVSEEFKEVNKKTWKGKTKKGFIELLTEKYKTEARWNKAVLHLKERGELTNTVKDIGSLLKEVNLDLLEEEGNNIKEELFKFFWKELSKNITKGIPQWYKDKLVDNKVDSNKL